MPPIEPSVRGTLLTGASALALSVAASGAEAQSFTLPPSQNAQPKLTLWAEGALAYTAGGSFSVPSLPGLGAPFTLFKPLNGIEGAVGFDYQWANQPWHFVFDLRYGRTRTASRSSSSSSSSSSHSYMTSGIVFGVLQTQTTNVSTANSTATQATEWEKHLVADFMIGRDLGMGANAPEIEFGIRIADLRATAQAQQQTNSTTNTFTQRTFYSCTQFFCGPVTNSNNSSSSSSSWASAAWNSHFFGMGPRVAITGGVPIVGFWTFEYGAGIAELIGARSFNVSTSNNGSFSSRNSDAFVFNADGWAAVSYLFTPNYKLSIGIRSDFYDAALTSYNINTGALQSIDRLYWGPFIRFTGSFP